MKWILGAALLGASAANAHRLVLRKSSKGDEECSDLKQQKFQIMYCDSHMCNGGEKGGCESGWCVKRCEKIKEKFKGCECKTPTSDFGPRCGATAGCSGTVGCTTDGSKDESKVCFPKGTQKEFEANEGRALCGAGVVGTTDKDFRNHYCATGSKEGPPPKYVMAMEDLVCWGHELGNSCEGKNTWDGGVVCPVGYEPITSETGSEDECKEAAKKLGHPYWPQHYMACSMPEGCLLDTAFGNVGSVAWNLDRSNHCAPMQGASICKKREA